MIGHGLTKTRGCIEATTHEDNNTCRNISRANPRLSRLSFDLDNSDTVAELTPVSLTRPLGPETLLTIMKCLNVSAVAALEAALPCRLGLSPRSSKIACARARSFLAHVPVLCLVPVPVARSALRQTRG